MRFSRILGGSAVALLAVGLASCSTASDSGSKSDAAGDAQTASCTAAASGFPVEVKHVYGTTTIEEAPERVATVAWANHEVPLALGIVPVGMSKVTWGDGENSDGILPWVDDKIKELGGETPVLFDETDGIDFEAVRATNPDVILASYSGLSEEEYATLSKIAPVVAYPDTAWGTSVQDMVCMNANALGLGEEGAALNAEIESETASAMDANPELADTKFMFAFVDPSDLSKIGYYTSHDTRPGFLEAAGAPTPALVAESSAETDEFYVEISAEEADKFDDVDVFVTYGDPQGDLVKQLQADPLYSQIPAIAAGNIVILEDNTPLAASANPSPLSIAWGIGDYFELLNSTSAAK
ncbi:iron complex transport system substrate-binding protein [Leucobacter exalbidus]|uniref:Iron complex transport system substrate-binding protein n=1 Tax=Leucobacter exalbidus TaxID=662960 RepID=A0A940PS18_9MICO|nr:iron complex transport system substrate-binding protein [Leucobacter exalbidus]